MQRNAQCTAAFEALADWFETESGQALLQRETELVRERVRRFHGDCLLWLGPVAGAAVATSRCMVKMRLYAGPAPSRGPCDHVASLVARTESLPIAANSLDGVVVHHGLEYSSDPRSAIREITRVLRPGGRLLVCCFNPLSLWAVSELRGNVRPVTAFRLSEWLAVLGFAREGNVHYLNYRSTFRFKLLHPRWQRMSGWLNRSQAPVGGVYMTLATKESLAMIPGTRAFARGRHTVPPLTVPGTTHAALAPPERDSAGGGIGATATRS